MRSYEASGVCVCAAELATDPDATASGEVGFNP